MSVRFLRTAAAALSLAAMVAAGSATAADFPTKPVKFVVHAGAGGPIDGAIRNIAAALEKEAGWKTVVENRPGGGGAVAIAYGLSQPADGYTLISATGSLTFQLARGTAPFTADDLAFVRTLQGDPCAVLVHKDSPFKTVKDLVAHLKKEPRSVKMGGFSAGSFQRFIYSQLQKETGIDAPWIPFDSAKEASVALLGQHIDVAFFSPSTAVSQIEAGELRVIGIASEERSQFFPDVPTLKEQGYDIANPFWRGIVAKKGIPADVLAKINADIDTAVAGPDWKAYMNNFKVDSIKIMGEPFAELAKKEVADRRDFLREVGLLK
ncbi:MAG: tripartite tricarboxylate transporter substrate binding protein [Acetobacterales bacterium]